MDPEVALIKKVLTDGSIKEVIDSGIVLEHFVNPEAGMWFGWLISYYRDPTHPQAIPTEFIFKNQFPKAILPDIEDRTSVDELVALVKHKQFQMVVREVGEKLYKSSDEDTWEEQLVAVEDTHKKLLELMARSSHQRVCCLSDQAAALHEEYELHKRGGLNGILWPWPQLNEKIGGIENGSLTTFYGRPKNLKSWLGFQVPVCFYLSSFSGRSLIYSCELPSPIVRARLACSIVGVDYGQFRRGKLSMSDELRFQEMINALKQSEVNSCTNGHKKEMIILYPDDEAGLTDLQAKIEAYHPDLVVVDAVQYLSNGKGEVKNDWKFQSVLSRSLKRMAVSYNLPIIAIHQANRAKEGEGDLDDLAFSDSWARDSDVLIKVKKIKTNDIGNMCAMVFSGAREFDFTGMYIHAKPAHNFNYIDTIESLESLLEFIKWNKKKNTDREKHLRRMSGDEHKEMPDMGDDSKLVV